ncbi:ATP-dependent DNA helicase RecG [Salinibacillus xinjiangensis]|uniref:ATP-dependent DNA helicase RecG n=1 Tax=Salinibacillus xinjiangensis TaxID=1229268 RepID=A0A6G1X3N1_9BACI|nr:ATP-dependent DNA helicase RecG [Salinibacillus xinjiangensis]MRG85438.1 ATP-dependent DNA helicase RecG [Salinibacillus xinjiangensis]
MLANLPVTDIKGIGEKIAGELNDMGIQTVEDFLFHFPFRYDVHEIKPITEIEHQEKATLVGKVVSEPSLSFFGRKKSRLTVTLEVDHIAVKAVFFNQAFAKKHLQRGELVTVIGKWDQHRLQITVSQFQKGTIKKKDTHQPIYSLKGGISLGFFRKSMKQALNSFGTQIEEILPENYLTDYKIPARSKALQQMHFPENGILLKHAKRRFIYEELLLFQLKMQWLRKQKREATMGNAMNMDVTKINAFMDQLPFELTNAQKNVIKELLNDLKNPYQMNRLLQGDVGSGKTVVAAIGLYAAITAGKQGALMVPTEILAEQHFESLQELFGDKAEIVLLTGSVKGKKRKERLHKVKEQDADIVVGTHALIQDDVFFNDLGFVIVDEQHRFGVEQRRVLRDKGLQPDVLFMTATPIPRTLAITTFGDMDVSVIDEMPKGRKPVKTYWAKENMLDRVLNFVHKEIKQGHQAYVICPLVEESDKLDIQNAVDIHQQLQEFFPQDVRVGLMHGRLHTTEKDEVMKQFAQNELQILVSTTVVEVGVNVPNATMMLIYDAERFGLSQLHQLRGRVGRGDAQSYCILLADPKGETGKERMRIMTETNDGFELSEHDLKLRGPGDFFGKKQSGLPEFKVADLVQDYRALETARKDAVDMIESGRFFNDPSYKKLKIAIENDPIFNGQVLD